MYPLVPFLCFLMTLSGVYSDTFHVNFKNADNLKMDDQGFPTTTTCRESVESFLPGFDGSSFMDTEWTTDELTIPMKCRLTLASRKLTVLDVPVLITGMDHFHFRNFSTTRARLPSKFTWGLACNNGQQACYAYPDPKSKEQIPDLPDDDEVWAPPKAFDVMPLAGAHNAQAGTNENMADDQSWDSEDETDGREHEEYDDDSWDDDENVDILEADDPVPDQEEKHTGSVAAIHKPEFTAIHQRVLSKSLSVLADEDQSSTQAEEQPHVPRAPDAGPQAPGSARLQTVSDSTKQTASTQNAVEPPKSHDKGHGMVDGDSNSSNNDHLSSSSCTPPEPVPSHFACTFLEPLSPHPSHDQNGSPDSTSDQVPASPCSTNKAGQNPSSYPQSSLVNTPQNNPSDPQHGSSSSLVSPFPFTPQLGLLALTIVFVLPNFQH